MLVFRTFSNCGLQNIASHFYTVSLLPRVALSTKREQDISTLCSFSRRYIRFGTNCNGLTHFLTYALCTHTLPKRCPSPASKPIVIAFFSLIFCQTRSTDRCTLRACYISPCLSFSIFSLQEYTLAMGKRFPAHNEHNVCQREVPDVPFSMKDPNIQLPQFREPLKPQ